MCRVISVNKPGLRCGYTVQAYKLKGISSYHRLHKMAHIDSATVTIGLNIMI